MMNAIFLGMIVFSFVSAIFTGRMDALSAAAMEECGAAIQLVIGLAGMMCLWSGIMKVAQESRLTEKLSKLFSPVLKLLFKGLDHSSVAAQAIAMNITANLLGLGNAATPLGLKAMRELEKMEGKQDYATNNMVVFVVMNTASMQIIPTTTAMLRLQAGSASPLEILPAVWVTSLASLCGALLMAKALSMTRQPITKRNVKNRGVKKDALLKGGAAR